jgi:hypothetical protein
MLRSENYAQCMHVQLYDATESADFALYTTTYTVLIFPDTNLSNFPM